MQNSHRLLLFCFLKRLVFIGPRCTWGYSVPGVRGYHCGTFLKINMLGLFFVRNGVLMLRTLSKSATDEGKMVRFRFWAHNVKYNGKK